MKLKPFGAVFSAVLLIAPAIFAQDQSQQDQSQQGQTSAGQQATNGAQAQTITGTVTDYTPNQSISVKDQSGQTRQIALDANSNVSPDVKVGSKVKVSQSSAGGQQMVRVEPISGGGHAAKRGTSGAQGAAGTQRLPRTASGYPLLGLAGLLSLGLAAGIRVASRKLA